MADSPSLSDLTNRSQTERLREFKYRFAQSAVFGLPVLALHFYGPFLGRAEAPRWIGFLEILLSGWVVWIGLFAMVVEALLIKIPTFDSIIASIGLVAFLFAAISFIRLLLSQSVSHLMIGFPVAVAISILWNGLRWKMIERQILNKRSS
jgi:cation transport ATPase